jgi:molybdopterin-synthase adenylyltransferase
MDRPPTPPPADDLERYSRQARFWAVGAAGQARLRAARVAVIGCGALGSAAVDLLARGGVGALVVIDRDFVELSNLQRQVLFDEADAAAQVPKAVAAANAVRRINSQVMVEPHIADVTPANVEQLVAGAAVVIDGTDNFETRYLVNDACVKHGIPWVYGGAIGSTGMAMAVLPGDTPCLRCVFPVGQEAGKILLGDRQHLARGLATFDLWSNDYQLATGFPRLPDCPCCGLRRFDYLEAKVTSQTTSLCGRDAVQVSPGQPLQLDLAELGRRLATAGQVTTSPFLVRLAVDGRELTVFGDGRAIVKGTSDTGVARSLYARYVGT